jgi:predicted nucleic acid-binding protein
VPAFVNAGVVDAGVILTRLDRRRRSHEATVRLFALSARGSAALSMSVVNLAEALEHSEAYAVATGVDVVALLTGFGVTITPPDVDVARRVARLRHLDDASLADRFAIATTQTLGARLHTTDRTLAGFARRCRVPVTLY